MRIIRRKKPQEPNYNPPHKYWPKEPFRDLRASHWVEIFLTVALVLVGASQFYVYLTQAGIMSEQAHIAERQLESSQESERAYIIWKDIWFVDGDPKPTTKRINLRFVIKNVGRHVSTINKIVLIPNISKIRKNLADEPRYESNLSNPVIPPLAPDIEHQGRFQDAGDHTPEDIAGIISGQIPVFIYGYVVYDKGYRSIWPGVTGFCFEYLPPSKRPDGVPPFSVCDKKAYTYSY